MNFGAIDNFDITLKRGQTVTINNTWSEDGVLHNFSGSTARIQVYDECGNVMFLLTLVASTFGVVYFGSIGTNDQGEFDFTFTDAFTQAFGCQRRPYDFWADAADGTPTCIYDGTIYMKSGSPY
jgi:hypothetical protein